MCMWAVDAETVFASAVALAGAPVAAVEVVAGMTGTKIDYGRMQATMSVASLIALVPPARSIFSSSATARTVWTSLPH